MSLAGGAWCAVPPQGCASGLQGQPGWEPAPQAQRHLTGAHTDTARAAGGLSWPGHGQDGAQHPAKAAGVPRLPRTRRGRRCGRGGSCRGCAASAGSSGRSLPSSPSSLPRLPEHPQAAAAAGARSAGRRRRRPEPRALEAKQRPVQSSGRVPEGNTHVPKTGYLETRSFPRRSPFPVIPPFPSQPPPSLLPTLCLSPHPLVPSPALCPRWPLPA